MPVDSLHPAYEKHLPRWKLIRDMCEAENLKDHLIKRNPRDASPENVERNNQIFKRASFSAVAGYTAAGMLGLLFTKYPKVDLPTQLEYLLENADGAGNSIYQIAQQAASENIKQGRGGFLVDFPQTNGEVLSVADMQSGRAFATVVHYKAESIINWRTMQDGANVKLSLVMLKTQEIEEKDDYVAELVDVITELRLIEGVYTVAEWRYDKEKRAWYLAADPIQPTDGRGNTMDFIPFAFYGSESDDHTIDRAPMYDIARLNKDHYNNSAIYEDSVYQVGQAQPWMSGLTQEHLDLMAANNLYVGSGRMIGVPSGETFGIEQPEPNGLAKEAMTDKVEMMVSLGAMFLQRGAVAKTATQAADERSTRHSVLTLIAQNTSEGITRALQWCAKFMNATEDGILFEINQDFIDPETQPQELQAVVASFIQGAMPAADYARWMQRRGYFDEERPPEDYVDMLRLPGGGEL